MESYPQYVILCYNVNCRCKKQDNRVLVTNDPKATCSSLPRDPCKGCLYEVGNEIGKDLLPDAKWGVRVTLGPFTQFETARRCADAAVNGSRGWTSIEIRLKYLADSSQYNVQLCQGVPPGINATTLEHIYVYREREKPVYITQSMLDDRLARFKEEILSELGDVVK